MDFNATPWSCQPFLHELSMMILGIVEQAIDILPKISPLKSRFTIRTIRSRENGSWPSGAASMRIFHIL